MSSSIEPLMAGQSAAISALVTASGPPQLSSVRRWSRNPRPTTARQAADVDGGRRTGGAGGEPRTVMPSPVVGEEDLLERRAHELDVGHGVARGGLDHAIEVAGRLEGSPPPVGLELDHPRQSPELVRVHALANSSATCREARPVILATS